MPAADRSPSLPPSQTPRRTLAKSVTWQGLGLLTTTATTFAMTGSLAAGGVLALALSAVGTVMFVLHERAWDRVRWGRVEG